MKHLSCPRPPYLFCLLAQLALTSFVQSKPAVEFQVGRTPPAKNNIPILGSGLAMSQGYYRGSPLGELSGWTLSLWFEAKSDKKGDLLESSAMKTMGKRIV